MIKLPSLSGRAVISALRRGGYTYSHTEGSHHYYRKPGATALVTVPVHKGRDIPEGTLRSIIKQAGLADEEFLALLSKRTAKQLRLSPNDDEPSA